MRQKVVMMALAAVFALGSVAGAQIVNIWSENWDTGVINPSDWTVRDAGAVNVALADPCSNGDYALKLTSGGTAAWGDEIFSTASYSRQENLAITFLTWLDPTDHPSGYSSHAGFHNTDGSANDVYASMEAAMGYVYYDLRAAGGEDGAHGLGDVIGGNHMSLNDGPTPPGGGAITDAVSKDTALMVRIMLGGTSGAKWKWKWADDDPSNWRIEHDTRGNVLASSAPDVWLGFGPFGGGNYGSYIDDISVDIIPEPMTMTLFGLGGLALLRRRRRA